MKPEKTIYINCNECLFSKTSLFAIIFTGVFIAGLSFSLNFYQIINELSTYFILFSCALVVIYGLYNISKETRHHYIFINNDEISFKQNKLDEEIRLRFELIEYFETHFSKIVFSTKDHEKIILQLDKIANEQKRWEIKDFLRGRVKQLKASNFDQTKLVYATAS